MSKQIAASNSQVQEPREARKPYAQVSSLTQKGKWITLYDNGTLGYETINPFEPPVARGGTYIQRRLPISVGGRSDIALHPGLFIISGGTAVGKSLFIRKLAEVVELHPINVVEPYDSYEQMRDEPAFVSVDHAIGVVLQHPNALCVLDSLRAPLYELEGAAGPKGITASFFTALTRLSNTLAQSGITLIATVNPMISDSDYVAEFHQKLSASVPGYIWLETLTRSGGDVEPLFTGAVSLRPKREEKQFSFSLTTAVSPLGEDVEVPIHTMRPGSDGLPPLTSERISALFDRAHP